MGLMTLTEYTQTIKTAIDAGNEAGLKSYSGEGIIDAKASTLTLNHLSHAFSYWKPQGTEIASFQQIGTLQRRLSVTTIIIAVTTIPLLTLSILFAGLYITLTAGAIGVIAILALTILQKQLSNVHNRQLEGFRKSAERGIKNNLTATLKMIKERALEIESKEKAEADARPAIMQRIREKGRSPLPLPPSKNNRLALLPPGLPVLIFSFLSVPDLSRCLFISSRMFTVITAQPSSPLFLPVLHRSQQRLLNLLALSQLPRTQHTQGISLYHEYGFQEIEFIEESLVGCTKRTALRLGDSAELKIAAEAPLKDFEHTHRLFIGQQDEIVIFADKPATEETQNIYTFNKITRKSTTVVLEPTFLQATHERPVLFKFAQIINKGSVILYDKDYLSIYDFSQEIHKIKSIRLRDCRAYTHEEDEVWNISKIQNMELRVVGQFLMIYANDYRQRVLESVFNLSTLTRIDKQAIPSEFLEAIYASKDASIRTPLPSNYFYTLDGSERGPTLKIFSARSFATALALDPSIRPIIRPIYERTISENIYFSLHEDLLCLSEFARREIVYLPAPAQNKFSFNLLEEVFTRQIKNLVFSIDCSKMAYDFDSHLTVAALPQVTVTVLPQVTVGGV